ncbi:YdhK family protein [Paraliobacillus salinarum]|uniref:YdhK family protein n=1 Tax=Paraliobacillus salinarum TaxID=1158996 RepID=UPI001FE7FABF|nr:YdhK family protein [Paraliobacillus salinarum]
MTLKKIIITLLTITSMLFLAACGGEEPKPEETTETEQQNQEQTDSSDHGDMNMSGSGEVPEGLEKAENPTYEVGSQATVEKDHMEGMKGAQATIAGAYDTTVYTVSYTPTTGGEKVTDHKWVIHEELKDVSEQPLEPGEEATIQADHMEGMNGAQATIDSAKQTTVYMIDFELTTSGEKVTNHKWVTEDELSPPE